MKIVIEKHYSIKDPLFIKDKCNDINVVIDGVLFRNYINNDYDGGIKRVNGYIDAIQDLASDVEIEIVKIADREG